MTEPETDIVSTDDGRNRAARSWLVPLGILAILALVVVAIARTNPSTEMANHPHGPIAADISAALGEPVPYASDEQLETFERGREVALMRFTPEQGLGPSFNVTFCTACHERPVTGGSAGLYRNFFLGGTSLPDGSFVPAESVGEAGGVIRMYSYDPLTDLRPPLADEVNVLSQRNPIPFFGVGLLAEVPDAEILSREDPDDADGDGISGHANFDRGFVGRFGRKAQTVSLEGFLRGPLFNHLGITTDPLTDAEKARLPVDSSTGAVTAGISSILFQAAAPDDPLVDFDSVPDPELSNEDVFDLVSYSMLLAAPQIDEPNAQERRGAEVFDALACGSCHTPRIQSPRGPLPVYSDLLLHDMGPDLADGVIQGDATGSEFRTQPLWGLTAVGPYLHDGRASTIEEAILLHGGEATAARDAADALGEAEMQDLVAFLESLGGRTQFSAGLIAPGTPIDEVGTLGGPRRPLDPEDERAFLAGRDVFDRDFSFADGVGAFGFNGDSCRACHFDPEVAGAGPLGVNVMRHGYLDGDTFVYPEIGTILHKQTSGSWFVPEPRTGVATVFEFRQTPPLFGLGLIDELPDEAIFANADPDDADGDGISGVPSVTPGGHLGRFGWKAQIPTLEEFVRDAIAAEMGMTMDAVPGLFFGITQDDDDVADAEFRPAEAELLLFYLQQLAPPPRRGDPTDPVVTEGEMLFATVGCSSCHVPELGGPDGPVAAYSDFLLHETLPAGTPGIEDGTASMREFRTAPLWGLALTAPYMHDGLSTTIDAAVRAHAGEAAAARDAYVALSDAEREAVLAFLESL
jgi:CxxC motif-containing protein (DUF1111 family)